MKIKIYEMSMRDWKAHGLSDRNRRFLSIRKSAGTNKNELKTISWDKGNLKMYFEITPTYKGKKDPYTKKVQSSFLNYDKKGNQYKGSHYDAIIEMANLGPELEDWEELTPQEKNRKVMKIFNTWEDIKFYCSCPAFLTQGSWKRLGDDLDSSVYPMPPLPDTGYWELGTVPNKNGHILGKDKAHDNGGFYLCKHLAGLLEQVKFLSKEVQIYLDSVLTGEKTVKKAKEDEIEKPAPEPLPKEPKKTKKVEVPEPVPEKDKKVIVKKNKKQEPKKKDKKKVEIPEPTPEKDKKVIVKKNKKNEPEQDII